MVIILGDLIVDVSMRIERFPVDARAIQRASYLKIGPGGGTNIAIAARRFGLSVACLGEVGDDEFGEIVLEGLAEEGIDTSGVVLTAGAATPVASVVVDEDGEPAYLGYGGSLHLRSMPPEWAERLRGAQALFADGWAEYPELAGIVLQALRTAREAGVPTFFDPGPGNPAIDNGWHTEAAALATVVLATEDEARRLTTMSDPVASGQALLAGGTELVILKRGVAGSLLITKEHLELSPGFAVAARDATGAGDSLAGATIYGYLKGLPLAELGTLANATGAAKVQKLGAGHSMPTQDEIRAVLSRFGKSTAMLNNA